jgi:DNA-binding XRE family transcriptional regulator
MAEEIGVSRRVYQHAERGGTPQPRHAAKFADHYGISVMDLFYADLEIAA